MRKFDSQFLERIKDTINIVDVIGSYLPLKKKGNRYWGCCPFHQEKNPSFSVSPEDGFYYCFGCHAGGDVISFVEKIESLSFPEAVERLAEIGHIEIPKEEMSDEERQRVERNEELLKATELAGAYFHNCLVKTKMGEEGLAYFEKRQLSRSIIESFRLGFAPDSWQRLYRDFTEKKHVRPDILAEAGLVGNKEGRYYDMFRHRCMFPILNMRGQIVAFGGRVLDSGKPKYLNSPETPIFNKRALLFALYQAVPEIKKTHRVIMVEGYMDAISLHESGITNVVASLGTAFTVEQARLLKRYADEVIFSYDMDAAGQAATKRALEIAGPVGLKLRVLQLPSGKDPDEFIHIYGKNAYIAAVENAKEAIEYLLDVSLQMYDVATLEGQQKILNDMFGVLVAQENSLQMNAFIRKLARTMHMDEGLIRSEAMKYAKEHHSKVYISLQKSEQARVEVQSQTHVKRVLLEEGVLRYSLRKGRLPEGWELLQSYSFIDSFHEKIFRIFNELNVQGIRSEMVESKLDRSDLERWAAFCMGEEGDVVSPMDVYIRPLKKIYLQEAYRIHTKRAAELLITDPEGARKEQLRCIELNREIRELSKIIEK